MRHILNRWWDRLEQHLYPGQMDIVRLLLWALFLFVLIVALGTIAVLVH
jgi:hypothetical protein